jgi:hypothetical protein
MAANSFAKESIVAFENQLAGFEDMLVVSKAITVRQNKDGTC